MADDSRDLGGTADSGIGAFEALFETLEQPVAVLEFDADGPRLALGYANRLFQARLGGVYVAGRSVLAAGLQAQLIEACRAAADGPADFPLRLSGVGEFRGVMVPIGADPVTRFALTLRGAREATERDQLAIDELKRRLRGVLATVRSIVRRSSRSSEGLPQFVDHLEGRIGAVARSQALLIATPGLGADLETLLRGELRAQAINDARVTISGPNVRLSPAATEGLALAFHELTTNAIKFDAFASPRGSLDVAWTVEASSAAPMLRLTWSESGAEPARPDGPPGFGSEVVTRRLAYELRGSGSVEPTPSGIRVRIAFPIIAGGRHAAEPAPQEGGVQ